MARFIAPNGTIVEADAEKAENLLRAGFRRSDDKPAAKKSAAKKSTPKKK